MSGHRVPVSDSPHDVDSQIAARDRETDKVRERLIGAAHRDDTDRSFIARIVVLGFGGLIALVMMLSFVAALKTGEWHDFAATAVDLLKSVLLPVVTLILGYYFGRAAKG